MREPGSGTRATLEALSLGRSGIEPPERLTLGSNGALKQALMVGMGITLISRHAVARELDEGRCWRCRRPARRCTGRSTC